MVSPSISGITVEQNHNIISAEIMDEDDEDDAPAVSGETASVAHVTTEPERQSSPTIPAEYHPTSKDTPSPA